MAVGPPLVGPRAATIVWSMAARVGGEFVDFLRADQYARILANAPHDRPAWNAV